MVYQFHSIFITSQCGPFFLKLGLTEILQELLPISMPPILEAAEDVAGAVDEVAEVAALAMFDMDMDIVSDVIEVL